MAKLYKSEEVKVFFLDETGKVINWEYVKKQNKNIKNISKNDEAFHDFLATRYNYEFTRNERGI